MSGFQPANAMNLKVRLYYKIIGKANCKVNWLNLDVKFLSESGCW